MVRLRKFSKYIKNLLRALENHLGLVILMIFVIMILYAAFVFYGFVYKAITAPPEISFEKIEIKKAIFEEALEQLDARKQNASEIMKKEYVDIFK